MLRHFEAKSSTTSCDSKTRLLRSPFRCISIVRMVHVHRSHEAERLTAYCDLVLTAPGRISPESEAVETNPSGLVVYESTPGWQSDLSTDWRQDMAIRMTVNGRPVETNDDPRTPLLWVLRDTLGLSGTKFGCSIAQCGACTVMVEGNRTFNASPPGLPIASNL